MRNTIVRRIRSMSKRSGPKQTNVSRSWARNEGEISNKATTAGHMSKRSCKTQSNCKGTSEVCLKCQASEAINRSSKIITVNTSQEYFIASSPNPCRKRSNSWVHQILLAVAPERRHEPTTAVMTRTVNCDFRDVGLLNTCVYSISVAGIPRSSQLSSTCQGCGSDHSIIRPPPSSSAKQGRTPACADLPAFATLGGTTLTTAGKNGHSDETWYTNFHKLNQNARTWGLFSIFEKISSSCNYQDRSTYFLQ